MTEKLMNEFKRVIFKEIRIKKEAMKRLHIREKSEDGYFNIFKIENIREDDKGDFQYYGNWGKSFIKNNDFFLADDQQRVFDAPVNENAGNMGTCDMCGKHISYEPNMYDPLIISRYHTFGCGSKYDTIYLEFELCPDCYDKMLSNIILELKSVKNVSSSLGEEMNLQILKEYATKLLEELNNKEKNKKF